MIMISSIECVVLGLCYVIMCNISFVSHTMVVTLELMH